MYGAHAASGEELRQLLLVVWIVHTQRDVPEFSLTWRLTGRVAAQ